MRSSQWQAKRRNFALHAGLKLEWLIFGLGDLLAQCCHGGLDGADLAGVVATAGAHHQMQFEFGALPQTKRRVAGLGDGLAGFLARFQHSASNQALNQCFCKQPRKPLRARCMVVWQFSKLMPV